MNIKIKVTTVSKKDLKQIGDIKKRQLIRLRDSGFGKRSLYKRFTKKFVDKYFDVIEKCPDCNSIINLNNTFNTERHGVLRYYDCKKCKETFVSQDGGDLAISAP